MNIQSWMIKSWVTLEWYLPLQTEQLPLFKLAGLQIRDDGSTTGSRGGDTVWVAQDEHGHAGLAWEWVEVQPGIVMLADPNSIITNLQIVDSNNGLVSGLAKTIAVNRMVHALPWQSSICAQLQDTALNLPSPDVLAQRWPLQSQPVRSEQGAAMASGARVPALPARRATAATQAPHPQQNLNRRLLVDAPGRMHTRRSGDHEAGLDRRGLRDLRRAA